VLGAQLEPRHLFHLARPGAEDDDRHHEAFAPDRLEHLEPVELREHHVEDDEVGLVLADQRQPRLAVFGGEDVVAFALEVDAQAERDARVVFDDEDASLRDPVRGPHREGLLTPAAVTLAGSAATVAAPGRATGRMMRNVDPRPDVLSTSTRPRCARTMCLTIASPRPLPSRTRESRSS